MNISITPKFKRQLKKIEKKQIGLRENVYNILLNRSHRENINDPLIPGCKGYQIFKTRCPLNNTGKSSGARIIYFKDLFEIVALCIYLKSEQNTFSEKKVIRIFEQFHLNGAESQTIIMMTDGNLGCSLPLLYK